MSTWHVLRENEAAGMEDPGSVVIRAAQGWGLSSAHAKGLGSIPGLATKKELTQVWLVPAGAVRVRVMQAALKSATWPKMLPQLSVLQGSPTEPPAPTRQAP